MSTKHGSHWLEREDFDTTTVVRLKTPRRLDDDTLWAVFEPIYTLCDIGRTQLVLNLAAVEYLPSLGLGKLVMLNRKVLAGNGRLALCHLSHTVKDLLDSTHLSRLFNLCATEREALQSFSSGRGEPSLPAVPPLQAARREEVGPGATPASE